MDTSRDPVDLTIVIPAYEEAENLGWLLPRLRAVADSITESHEILVVDTPSPRDDTPAVCAAAGVRHLPRRGGESYGDAVRTGIGESRGRLVLFMDADGSHNPEFVPRLWEKREVSDLVIASRYVAGGRTENPAILIFMSLVVNIGFRLVLGLRCHDVSNSFRLYRGDDLRGLHLSCDHFDIVEEILVLLARRHPGYRIREVPTTFEERKAGKTKRKLFVFALSYAAVLWRLRRLRGRANESGRAQ